MINENVIYLALLISLSGSVVYSISTIRGRTKPNRVTWFLWSFIPMIAFIAQLSEGIGPKALFSLIVGVGPLLVFISSFANQKAYWKIGSLDYGCGIISVLAIGLWLTTGVGLLAVVFAITADFLAAIPTIVKSFNYPATENSNAYGIYILSSGMTALTINNWVFIEYGFILYILLVNITLFALTRFTLGLKIKKKLVAQ